MAATTKARAKHRSDPVAEAAGGIHHGQRRKVIVEQILAEILQGGFGPGERLVIQNLAARFGVSQSPIREALVTLEGIGIVDIEANRGAIVRHLTATEVNEVCQVRQALECAAVRLACGRIDFEPLMELADAFRQVARKPWEASEGGPGSREKPDVEQARRLDSRLHDLIAASCGNRMLSRELGRLEILFRSFRDVSWNQRSVATEQARIPEEAQEHLAIVEALLQCDAKAASRAMARHIRRGAKYWASGLRQ